MSVQTNKWHQDCLNNFKSSLDNAQANLRREIERVEQLRRLFLFEQFQLSEAIREDKVSYDGDRYKIDYRKDFGL